MRVALVECRGAARGLPNVRHVPRWFETLIGRAVELAAQSAGIVVVQPPAVVLKVQDQPQLNTGIGDGDLDTALARFTGLPVARLRQPVA